LPHGDDFSSSRSGLEHQAEDSLVPAVPELGPSTGLEQGSELVVAEGLHDPDVELGRVEPDEGVVVDLALLEQPRGEAPHREMPRASRGRLRTGAQEGGDERRQAGSVEGRETLVRAVPEVAAHPVAVRLDRLGAHSLGPQVQLPGRQEDGQVGFWSG